VDIPLLSEHQAPDQGAPEPDANDYEPSEQDEKDIRLVEKLFAEAKQFKKKYDERWNDFYNMFRGRQWKDIRPSYRHSEVINLIFREIQSSVPIQLDTRPKFDFLPMEPSDLELADILNQVCEADWTKFNWLGQITECVFDGHIFGTGLAGMCFDPKKDLGAGEIVLESEDPFYHFPCPQARNFNVNMPWHIKAEPMQMSDVKRKWPNGKFVTPDVVKIARMDVGDKNKVRMQSPVTSSIIADQSQQVSGSDSPEALVITLWLDHEYEVSEEQVDEQADDGAVNTKFVQKKTYPHGRKIVICNKVLLESGDNEYDDLKIPFARYQNYVNQRQFWGIGDIEQLESPQKIFNKLISFSLDVLTLMGNPIWLVGADAGVDTENLFNQPGLIIEANDISKIQRQEGVQLQPYVLQLIDRLKSWFDDVSGSNDVSRGAKPEGITAASAIQSLQEAAQTRIRQKSRNLDDFLQDLGQMYMSRVFQFRTAPEVFRLTNKDGSYKFFKFHVDTVEPEPGAPAGTEPQKVARYRPFQQGEDGQHYEGQEKVVAINGTLDVKVNTGSTLVFAKADREQRAFALFDRQIIDGEEVLKTLDYPNWEAVLQRVQQRQVEAAQAQAQAQGGGQPPAA
jgi:hypothetical protein